MMDYSPKHPLPAILSTFFPGLGQMVKGDVGRGIGFFFGFFFGLLFGGLPGIIVWVANIHDAYNYNRPTLLAPPVWGAAPSGRLQPAPSRTPQRAEEETLPPEPRLGARKFWGTVFILGAIALLFFTVLEGSALWPGFFLAGLPMSLGSLLWGTALRREAHWREEKKKAQERKWEKEILRCAQRHGGRVTAPQVVMETSLSLEEAKKQMEEMSAQGHVGISISEGGALIYEFYEFAEDPAQGHAERLMGPVNRDEDWLLDELRNGRD